MPDNATQPPLSGTLTFLFADLESSTRLWEEHPVAMKTAMARHDAILRSAVETSGGVVVKTTGDGLMAVFGSAGHAVAGAIAAQQGLTSERWGETGPLRARMGLNSGEAEPREGDYFGSPVYRAARIMSAAHGGQVLLSGLTASLAGAEGLPAGVELRDLGEHRLKDLLQPERIFQLLHTSLPADFPALTTLARRPNNLPIQASELIGRREELAEIRRHLAGDAVRLLTLVGPGGIGKTRLALQAAADQLDRFADGVYFVDLSAARDSAAALAQIAQTIGLTGAADQAPAEILREQLGARQLLLVLDNFEQVIEAADDVAALLQVSPRLRVMVTSREALRVRGEQLLPVSPLSLPDARSEPAAADEIAGYEAVRLFVDRARAARPDFRLTDANAAAVAEVCARLDGLPLAIELAAARLNLFSPDELRDRLRRSLDVLRGGARDMPVRQQTLRGTIEWSYELLDDDERTLFELLSVFAGASVDAVETVAGEVERLRGVDVLEGLSSLVDKSLVRSVQGARGQRLSMLETIREYAAERLAGDAALAAAVGEAHARHYAALAATQLDALLGVGRADAFGVLAAELDNLRAAWQHWLAAADLGQLQVLFDALWIVHEGRGWYHAAIGLASELLAVLSSTPTSTDRLEHELTLRLSVARGLLAVRGNTREIGRLYDEALALVQSGAELPANLPALRSVGNLYVYRGQLDAHGQLGQRILELGERMDDSRFKLEGHFMVAVTRAFTGEVEAGLDHLRQADALFDPLVHWPTKLHIGPSVAVSSRNLAALLYWMTGRLDSARLAADEALERAAALDHQYTLAYALFHVALYDLLDGRHDLAARHADRAMAIADEHDYPIWRAAGLIIRGVCLARDGRAAEGRSEGERGLAQYQNLTSPPMFWPSIMALLAETYLRAGDVSASLGRLDAAIATTPALDLRAPLLFLQKGDVLAAAGDADGAAEWLRRGYSEAARMGVLTGQLRAALALAEQAGSSPAADDVERLRTTLARFSEGANHPELVSARATLERLAGAGQSPSRSLP